MFIGVAAFSQRSIAVDTINGNETVSFVTMNGAKIVQALCTNVGGTSDGTLTLYGSLDGTSWTFINFLAADLGTASPKGSITGADLNQITITDALVANWVINTTKFPYTKIVGVGTASDSTLVTIKYSK